MDEWRYTWNNHKITGVKSKRNTPHQLLNDSSKQPWPQAVNNNYGIEYGRSIPTYTNEIHVPRCDADKYLTQDQLIQLQNVKSYGQNVDDRGINTWLHVTKLTCKFIATNLQQEHD